MPAKKPVKKGHLVVELSIHARHKADAKRLHYTDEVATMIALNEFHEKYKDR